ncbi:hypothetical protein Pcinc_016997 [Petrolisthes cinctipes]|uniref:Uncharacterized protein n=1 Tax=Petrolisthes cinctipes TaxID=88211 RepID=A0AAE1FQ34_PETCI|nr:hypothetical protein Pcinc_016997 [Petrolisthes cinctipes]
MVVLSANPSFLANWTYMALQAGLLVWPTQLLALTRLPVSHLDSFHVAFSQANALTISCPSQTRCKDAGRPSLQGRSRSFFQNRS